MATIELPAAARDARHDVRHDARLQRAWGRWTTRPGEVKVCAPWLPSLLKATMTQEYATALRVAQALAIEAGQRMQRERARGFEISLKGRNDLVTTVDRSVEAFLRQELAAIFPQDALHGEEYGDQAQDGASRVWLIDPIDGTTNFSRGIPVYCVSIALQEHGQTVVGVIYDPNRQELFSAQRGQGAWLNGEPMQVSAEQQLGQSIVVTGFPPLKEGERVDAIIARLGAVASATGGLRRFGSAALDLASVAAGRLDAYWEFGLSPWDTAAGYLMVQEAGGQVSDAQGQPFDARRASVVATNGHLHEGMLSLLQKIRL